MTTIGWRLAAETLRCNYATLLLRCREASVSFPRKNCLPLRLEGTAHLETHKKGLKKAGREASVSFKRKNCLPLRREGTARLETH